VNADKVQMFLCSVQTEHFWVFLFFEHTMTGVVYLDMLQEFIMPIFEKQGPNYMSFQQDGASPHFHIAVWTSWTESSTQTDWQTGPVT
jgi:hypothetical protein